MNPRNVDYKKAETYYDGFDQKLVLDLLNKNKRLFSALHFVLSKLKKTDKQILDIGCGIGYTTFEIARNNSDSEVTGIDLSKNLIDVSNKLFKRKNLIFNSKNIISDKSSFNNKYDLIILIDVFEHIRKGDRGKFLNVIKGLFNEEWRIILSTPSHLHQKYLEIHNPAGLQPIDEKIYIDDYIELAKTFNGSISYFGYQSIWKTNDYCYCIIESNLKYDRIQPFSQIKLISHIKLLWILQKNGLISFADIGKRTIKNLIGLK
jgi:SAM-dependent methyltransferase